ncbi:cation-transporting P-type ATPase [Paraburkholderia caribensis]|uniref:cation-transporting P-type ATPase n=1 Tax=Paraburkholderia caribensis TaxID=75105 RepID=UPI0031D17A55
MHQRTIDAASLADHAQLSTEEILARMNSTAGGLTADEAERRLRVTGPNRVVHDTHHTLVGELINRTLNPLDLLLLVLATASYVLGDPRAPIMIGVMVSMPCEKNAHASTAPVDSQFEPANKFGSDCD